MSDKPYDPPRLTPIETAALITAAVDAAEPFSLVRLGDGECAVLGVGKETPAPYTKRILDIWFGPAHPPADRFLDFAAELRDAVRNASLVGIPRVSRQLNEPLVSQFSRIFENYRLHSDHTIYTDSGAHNFFQFMRALDPWVRGREFLGLITCRELCVQVAEVFQVKKVVWHQIPPDFLTSQQIAAPPHFPDVYEKLRSEIDPPFKGALYLVGAGAFGKVYCDWIKQRGGIGIDIGSVFDGWAGVRVRQRLELRKDLYSLERYRVPLERSARLAEFREVMQRNLRDVVAPDELQFLIAEARGVASGHPGT